MCGWALAPAHAKAGDAAMIAGYLGSKDQFVYFEGTRSQSQSPIGAHEGHLSYDFKPRLWASLDGNFWFGGKTTVNGVQNPLSDETNSRIGGTVAVPITKHQSLKFSYSTGTCIRYGELPRLGCMAVFVAGKPN
jgi:hypothetical protein